jgi:hypothetical protein
MLARNTLLRPRVRILVLVTASEVSVTQLRRDYRCQRLGITAEGLPEPLRDLEKGDWAVLHPS